MADKKITPKEAAMAVLKRAKELYEASTLAKAETGHEKGVATAVNPEKPHLGVSSAGMQVGASKHLKASNPKLAEHKMGEAKKASIGRMMEQEKIKPNLPKSEEGMGKSEEANPDEKQDAQLGEQVEEAVHTHEAAVEHPGQHADGSEMKGHIKLAKFMGRMEHKKSMKKADGQTLGAAIGYPGAAQTAPMPTPTPPPTPPMGKSEKESK